MTRTNAPTARIVPHIRGKPVTWLMPLPPNRGPTEPGAPRAAVLSEEQSRPPLKRGAKPAVRQNIARRGREPTNYPIRAVFRCGCQSFGSVGYSTVKRIRGPNLIRIVQTHVHGREGPGCRREKQIGDI